jgi:hypothetical protein
MNPPSGSNYALHVAFQEQHGALRSPNTALYSANQFQGKSPSLLLSGIMLPRYVGPEDSE